MKIASITVYCNEDFRLDSWYNFYNDYSSRIYKHIIVNNGKAEDTVKLKEKFPNSIVLYSNSKALTVSYNLGLELALADKEVDSIMLIGNDIKIDAQNVENLHKFLNSNAAYGMVAPVLLKKDSTIVEVYGAIINYSNLKFKHLNAEESLDHITNETQLSDSVSGGMNLSKRSFYEILGLQDENLFMYADEIDMGIRAKKSNIIFASTTNAVAWHQHVDRSVNQVRSPLAGYLIARNSIYLAHKHFTLFKVFSTFGGRFYIAIRIIFSAWLKNKSKDHKKYCYCFLLGTFAGLINYQNIPTKL